MVTYNGDEVLGPTYSDWTGCLRGKRVRAPKKREERGGSLTWDLLTSMEATAPGGQ